MARTKGSTYGKSGRRRIFTATRFSPAERAALEQACERDGTTISEWLHRLALAELSRLAVRTQLEATL